MLSALAAIRQAIGFARLDGLVGHELLQRFVVRMDFGARASHLHEPGAIALRQVLTRLPHSRNGVFASRLAAGSLGTAVLRHLDPVFDSRVRLQLGSGREIRIELAELL